MKDRATFRKQIKLMGSAFEFAIVAHKNEGDDLLNECINEVRRIEALLTEFSDSSQTALLNRSAGSGPIQVEEEVYALLARCEQLSKLTQGAFDITASLLKKLYNFKGAQFSMPDRDRLEKTLAKTGYEKILLMPDRRVCLQEAGMHIGFGAIGKGYAADCVKKMLMAKGVAHGVINASGDLTAWGHRPDGAPWKIGIAHPEDPSHAMMWIPVKDTSVATSGDYEQYFELNGERFSHTIDPGTGMPVKGVRSVTVVSPSAELCDALATAVFIMGPSVGLHFIEQLPGTHALVIDDGGKIYMSQHLKLSADEKVAV